MVKSFNQTSTVERRRTALHCAALSGVEVSGVEVSGAMYCAALRSRSERSVALSVVEMPRGGVPSGAEGKCIMRKMLCEIDLEKAQGYPGKYPESRRAGP